MRHVPAAGEHQGHKGTTYRKPAPKCASDQHLNGSKTACVDDPKPKQKPCKSNQQPDGNLGCEPKPTQPKPTQPTPTQPTLTPCKPFEDPGDPPTCQEREPRVVGSRRLRQADASAQPVFGPLAGVACLRPG